MRIAFEWNIPYSLSELFNPKAHNRANELRRVVLDAYDGDKKKAAAYMCRPRFEFGRKSLFDMSISSEEQHAEAIFAVGRMVFGVYS
jgi:uncharacterized protein (DUF2384 family)